MYRRGVESPEEGVEETQVVSGELYAGIAVFEIVQELAFLCLTQFHHAPCKQLFRAFLGLFKGVGRLGGQEVLQGGEAQLYRSQFHALLWEESAEHPQHKEHGKEEDCDAPGLHNGTR